MTGLIRTVQGGGVGFDVKRCPNTAALLFWERALGVGSGRTCAQTNMLTRPPAGPRPAAGLQTLPPTASPSPISKDADHRAKTDADVAVDACCLS
jgi:hypothetical protein